MRPQGANVASFSDYLLYDERKGRILHAKHLNRAQSYEMWRLPFNTLRPDLPFYNLRNEDEIQRMSKGIQTYLRQANQVQMTNCMIHYPDEYPGEKCYPIVKQQMQYLAPHGAMPLLRRVYDWREAEQNRSYVKKVLYKIESFGLNYPNLSKDHSEEQLAQAEDDLYQYFMQRFREKPTVSAEAA